jgi:hypothetical protein
LDDDDLFSHRAVPKIGLAAADDLASDLFPAKAALNLRGNVRAAEAAGINKEEEEEQRDIFNSLPKASSHRSRDRYDRERTRRNTSYGRSDRVDKWTKNSDLATRIDRGGEQQAPWRDNNNNNQRGGSRRNNNNRSFRSRRNSRSRSRSNSYSPDRRPHHPRRGNNHRQSYVNREERELGARFDDDRRSGRDWDQRDRD